MKITVKHPSDQLTDDNEVLGKLLSTVTKKGYSPNITRFASAGAILRMMLRNSKWNGTISVGPVDRWSNIFGPKNHWYYGHT